VFFSGQGGTKQEIHTGSPEMSNVELGSFPATFLVTNTHGQILKGILLLVNVQHFFFFESTGIILFCILVGILRFLWYIYIYIYIYFLFLLFVQHFLKW
jgi:hypothetical protein